MCLGMMASEGYHAGAVRQLLIQQAFVPVAYYNQLKVYKVTGVREPLPSQWHDFLVPLSSASGCIISLCLTSQPRV